MQSEWWMWRAQLNIRLKYPHLWHINPEHTLFQSWWESSADFFNIDPFQIDWTSFFKYMNKSLTENISYIFKEILNNISGKCLKFRKCTIGTLLQKLSWPIVRKKCSGYLFLICSNSERSEQFLVAECFFNLFLEVSQI